MIEGLKIRRKDAGKSATTITEKMSKWDDVVRGADTAREDREKDQIVDQVGRRQVVDQEVVQRVGVQEKRSKGDQ